MGGQLSTLLAGGVNSIRESGAPSETSSGLGGAGGSLAPPKTLPDPRKLVSSFAVFLYGTLDAGAGLRQIARIHGWPEMYFGVKG